MATKKKTKLEEIVIQEMNLLSCYSRLQLIKDEINRLQGNHFDLLCEKVKLQRWFSDRNLPLPKRH